LVSARVGIVSRLEECMAGADEPLLARVAAETADGEETVGVSLGPAAGIGGAGFTLEDASGAAVGEAIERYAGCFLPFESFVRASARKLGPAAVEPESFGLFHPLQHALEDFRYVPFTSDSVVDWCRGWNVATDEEAWLPVELVYLADTASPDRPRIGYSTSSGMACGRSGEEALEHALLELLERDAFMLTWLRRHSPARLDCSDDERVAGLDVQYFRPAGLEYAALDLSGFHGLPIVLGVVRGGRGQGGALGVGAAAAPTVERAWWKALSEAFACRAAGLKLSILDPDRRFADDHSDVLTFEDHIRYYADERRAEAAAFLVASSETRDIREVPTLGGETFDERRAELVERFERAGTSVFAVDVTSPDVRTTGLRVVKAIAPCLCALDVVHTARFLGSARLLSEMDTLTRPPAAVEDLNPFPHPFP
jgi:ribosomal protein S12 methylthiotransferase accessory factor